MAVPRSRSAGAAFLLTALTAGAAACGDDGEDLSSATVVTVADATSPDPTAPEGTAAMTTTPDDSEPAGTTSEGTGGRDGSAAVDPGDLEGRTFLATAAEGHELVSGAEVRLEFGPDGLSGTGGCNRLVAAPWALEGDVLVLTGPLGMTEMACDPPELMEQDTWLADLLVARPTVTIEADTLTLTSEDAVLTLTDREVADPDRELEGTAWELESLVTADAVASVPVGVSTPTLTIEGGQLQAHLGCNRGMGGVTVGDGTIEIAALASTRMVCEGDADEVERHVLTVLDGTVEFTIEADQLTLSNGENGAIYRAAG